ncbi:MAG: diguanylate cyclase [Alphaproteobacteria bacterium]
MARPTERPRILIVDDAPANVRTLLAVLGDAYEVFIATNGKDALEVAATKPPNLVLLDVVMPGMDGFEVCRTLRREPATRDIPVLFISSLESSEDSVTGFQAGGLDFIRKPFHKDEVLARVQTHLQLGQAKSQLQSLNRDLRTYIDIVDRYVLTTTTDLKGNITYASRAFCEKTGYSMAELAGQNHRMLKHPDMAPEVYEDLWTTILDGLPWTGEMRSRCKDGSDFWALNHIDSVVNTRGEITGFISIRHDITDRKRLEALSVTDELTGLFNRRKFNMIFPVEIKRARRDGKALAMLILDVDHFKKYNDTYGHQAGDEALRAIGGVLRSTYKRAGDFIFRLGGEEFGSIFVAEDPKFFFQIAEQIRSLIEGLGIPHRENSASPCVTASIGVHVCQGQGIGSQEEIYKLADQALYVAKEKGRNRVEISMGIDGHHGRVSSDIHAGDAEA